MSVTGCSHCSIQNGVGTGVNGFATNVGLSFACKRTRRPIDNFANRVSGVFSRVGRVTPFVPCGCSGKCCKCTGSNGPLTFVRRNGLHAAGRRVAETVKGMDCRPVGKLGVRRVINCRCGSVSSRGFVGSVRCCG